MPPETRQRSTRAAVAENDASPKLAIAEELPQSPNVRLRQSSSNQFATSDAASITSRRSNRSNAPDEPPRFTIDLSLPPEKRYLEVCAAFQSEMLNLTSLFDEVVGGMLHFISIKWLRLVCKLLLRKVYSNEENAELKGISKASGVDIYLLVCFNVLLDLFMGCSSGSAIVRAGAGTYILMLGVILPQTQHPCCARNVFRGLDASLVGLRRPSVSLRPLLTVTPICL